MALGPLAADDPTRDQATEFVPALVPGEAGDEKGGAYRSGTDRNGDGAPGGGPRNDHGALAIGRLWPPGSTPHRRAPDASPRRAIEINGDGVIDLAGEVPVGADDPIGPRFTDVATFDGERYSNRTPGARAFHARLAEPRRPRSTDAERLRDALERAWHA